MTLSRPYIEEQNSKLNELAYYGPFSEEEMEERLNDAFADLMASGLANINAIYFTDEQAAKYYINPREFWMSQLASLEQDKDEVYSKDGTFNVYGRCDTCGAPCDAHGCEFASVHQVALV